MKMSLVAIVLALAVVTAAQTTAAPPAQTPTASQPATAAPVIKDPAEYNAYMGAMQQQDPNAKISGLEAFLVQYPNSVVKTDALELLMGAYQQTANQAKTLETAQRVIQASPNNVRALALLAYTMRVKAQGEAAGPGQVQDLADAKQYGEKGLQALQTFTKPDGVSAADFEKLKTQMAAIFNSAIGIAALTAKDFPTATKALRIAVDSNPTDFSLVYPLALAYLQSTPPDYLNGIWYAARASVVAPTPQYQQGIEKYARSQYNKYHAGEDGWAEVLAQAKASATPPPGFTIKPAPTPAEQAATLVQSKAPKDMSFAEWQLVLSSGKQEDADKVWAAIKGVPLQMRGQVIKATATEIQIAASTDDIEKKLADIVLVMTGPIPARLMPKDNSQLDFGGTPVSYTPTPFMMTMDNGTLLKAATPEPPKRPPVHRRPPVR